MNRSAGRWLATAAVAMMSVVGCAHAPARTDQAGAGEQRLEPVLVTGSRIAQWVDPTSQVPATTSNVRIYSREELLRTGRDGDVGASLQALDPSVDVRHR